MSNPKTIAAAVSVAVVLVVVGLWAFEPWRLVTNSEIDQAVPVSQPLDEASATPEGTAAAPSPSPRDTVLSVGRFEDAEHATSGSVRLIELADGRRFVRLEGLASSDGPDLHVWLSDQSSGGEWGSYDDGRHVALGLLKATHGNHNYAVPADADLSAMRSVVIWCDRFNVAFGTAPVGM